MLFRSSECINEPQTIQGTITLGFGTKQLTRKAWTLPRGILGLAFAISGVTRTILRVTGLTKLGFAISGRIGLLQRIASTLKLGFSISGVMRVIGRVTGALGLGFKISGSMAARTTGMPWVKFLVDDDSIGAAKLLDDV